MLDEIREKVKVPKNYNDEQPQTPERGVRKSTRISRPIEQYSHSLYYLSLTNSSESKRYEEIMQVKTNKKWEQAMEKEMDNLMHNQSWDN